MSLQEKSHKHLNRNNAPEPEPEAGSFDVVSWLEQMGRDTTGAPQFLAELGNVVSDVVEAMRHVAIKKGGEASGKVTVEFSLDLEGTTVYTTAKITPKTPSLTLNRSTAFIGPGGRLVDQDPRQFAFQWQGGGTATRTEIKAPAGGGGSDLRSPEK